MKMVSTRVFFFPTKVFRKTGPQGHFRKTEIQLEVEKEKMMGGGGKGEGAKKIELSRLGVLSRIEGTEIRNSLNIGGLGREMSKDHCYQVFPYIV